MDNQNIVLQRGDIDKIAGMIKYALESSTGFSINITFFPQNGESSDVAQPDSKKPEMLKSVSESKDLEVVITDYLRKLGFRMNIKGFGYIREAEVLLYEDPSIIHSITKVLYPELAKRFNTTSSRIERAIRHSIETTWQCGNRQLIDEMYGFSVNPSKGKPTNAEFLAMLAEYIRQSMQE